MAVDDPIRTGTLEQPLQTAPNLSLSQEERSSGALCHFAGIFGWLGALVAYVVKKDSSPWVAEQGRCALNFQLTNLIFMLLCAVTLIGTPLAIAIHFYGVVMAILAGLKVKEGESYKYPFSFNLIK